MSIHENIKSMTFTAAISTLQFIAVLGLIVYFMSIDAPWQAWLALFLTQLVTLQCVLADDERRTYDGY